MKSLANIYLVIPIILLSAFLFISCADSSGGGGSGSGESDEDTVVYDFEDGELLSAFGMSGDGWAVANKQQGSSSINDKSINASSSTKCLRALGNSTKEACITIAGISGAGEISFSISTLDTLNTQDYGNLTFYLDGEDISSELSLDAGEDWHDETVSIEAGTHIFKWCADYNDAFLDDISIPGFTISNACEDVNDVSSALTAFNQGIASASIDNGTDTTDPNHYYYKYRNSDSSVTIEYDYTLSGGVPVSGNGQYTFNNYSNNNITVDGTLSYTIVYTDANTYDYTYSGTITFGGDVDFDITYDYTWAYDDGTITFSGTQEVGDCTFTYNSDGTITQD